MSGRITGFFPSPPSDSCPFAEPAAEQALAEAYGHFQVSGVGIDRLGSARGVFEFMSYGALEQAIREGVDSFGSEYEYWNPMSVGEMEEDEQSPLFEDEEDPRLHIPDLLPGPEPQFGGHRRKDQDAVSVVEEDENDDELSQMEEEEDSDFDLEEILPGTQNWLDRGVPEEYRSTVERLRSLRQVSQIEDPRLRRKGLRQIRRTY